MKKFCAALIRRTDGQDLVEYALLAGLISIASLAGVAVLGAAVNNTFQTIANQLAQP
jgi:pilus assembly protein Flp/PilA